MANFFEPGNPKQTESVDTTLSPAEQAAAKAKAALLGALLNARAGGQTSLKAYLGGAPGTSPVPGGLGDLLGPLMEAMNQPGAFTTHREGTTTGIPASTSGFSDLLSTVALGGGLLNSLGIHPLDFLGGLLGIGKTPGPQGPDTQGGPSSFPQNAGVSSGDPFLDSLIGGQYGSSPEMIPGGSISNLPSDYPGLWDSSFSFGGGSSGNDQAVLDLINSGLFGY